MKGRNYYRTWESQMADPLQCKPVRFSLSFHKANYSYNAATGTFATQEGQITVPAATFTQDATTGEWTVTPGAGTLTVTGTI